MIERIVDRACDALGTTRFNIYDPDVLYDGKLSTSATADEVLRNQIIAQKTQGPLDWTGTNWRWKVPQNVLLRTFLQSFFSFLTLVFS